MDNQLIRDVFPDIEKSLCDLLKNRLTAFQESAGKAGIPVQSEPSIARDLIKVFLYSEYVASALTRKPSMFNEFLLSNDLYKSYSGQTYASRLEGRIAENSDLSAVKEVLLNTKLQETVRIAWWDLAGLSDLDETLTDLSNLADAVVDKAVQVIYESFVRQYGVPVDTEGNYQRLIVLGMGKLGAGELNFSSDIDLIFVYLKEGFTNGESMISNEEFFTKVCRRFLKLFSAGSHEINFYRIDTRLRPYGDGGGPWS